MLAGPSFTKFAFNEVYSHFLLLQLYRCMESQSEKLYTAKVAFQVRIHPEAYTVSRQTTQRSDSAIDPLIPNDRIEWSTVFRSSTLLTALCVSLTQQT